MVDLPSQHLKKALDFVLDAGALQDAGSFAKHVVNGLPQLVASELTTLSICDLTRSVRRVVSFPGFRVPVLPATGLDHAVRRFGEAAAILGRDR